MNYLSMLSTDLELENDIRRTLDLFQGWVYERYDSLDSFRIAVFRQEPDIAIVDLDLMAVYPKSTTLPSQSLILVFVSSKNIWDEENAEWIFNYSTFDYIKKPVDIDRIITAVSVAEAKKQ